MFLPGGADLHLNTYTILPKIFTHIQIIESLVLGDGDEHFPSFLIFCKLNSKESKAKIFLAAVSVYFCNICSVDITFVYSLNDMMLSEKALTEDAKLDLNTAIQPLFYRKLILYCCLTITLRYIFNLSITAHSRWSQVHKHLDSDS